MKHTKIFLIVLILPFISYSCGNIRDEISVIDPADRELIINEAIESALIDEILKDIDLYSDFSVSSMKSMPANSSCVTVTKVIPENEPFWPRTVTLDFGDGCEDNGKLKSGKIIMEVSAPWYEPGSNREIKFENYSINGVSVEGDKEISNITKDDNTPSFNTIADLTLTYRDDERNITKIVKRESDKTHSWVAGFMDQDIRNEWNFSGSVEMTMTIGDNVKEVYTELINVIKVNGCRFPQSGIKLYSAHLFDGREISYGFDYGTNGDAGEQCIGDCDCMATLTFGDVSEIINLSEKWWTTFGN